MSGTTPRCCTATLHPEELRHGQTQAPDVVARTQEAPEIDQCLHCTLAERGLTYDQAAAVVLDRTGEYLRGRGAVAIDQHRQRPA